MKAIQLLEVFAKLDATKRIKFQNRSGWGNSTMAVNAILEQGTCYILIWCCHPKLILYDLKDNQRLVWYNPNCNNISLVKDYFPEYIY